MFKIKEIVKTSNEEIAGILKGEYLNVTETNNPIYAAAAVVTEDVNGAACYKSETHSPKTLP